LIKKLNKKGVFFLEAYCVKCKKKVLIKNEVNARVNGRSAVKGVCPKCGTNVFRFT
jgi:RNase P subunit RPR2